MHTEGQNDCYYYSSYGRCEFEDDMFNISTVKGSGIESSWKKELSVSSQSCQCDPYYSKEGGTQHPVVSSAGIQSCSNDSTCFARASSHDQRSATIQTDGIDPDKINGFLKRVEKLTQREIRKSIKHIEDWQHINRIHSTPIAGARCLHTIHADHLFNEFDYEQKGKQDHPSPEKKEYKMEEVSGNKYIVSNITWNCTSSMIAVAFEVDADHTNTWCSHESFLCLWSLFRTLDQESKPSATLTMDGCITCTSAHPNLATIYAVGTRSGKVFVVNTRFSVSHQTSKSTTCQGSFFSSSGNYTRSSNPASVHHTDSLSSLHWIPGKRLDHQQLVSIGMDGKIFVWLMDGSSLEEGGEEDTKDLTLCQAFVILIENVVGLRPNVSASSTLRGGGEQQEKHQQEQQQRRKGSKSYLPSSPSSPSSSQRRASVTKGAVSSSSSKTESSSASELGIISSSFSREDPYNFLVGCVGGSLFLCSLDTTSSGHNSTQNATFVQSSPSFHALEETGRRNISFTSPVRISYVSHRNNVNSVEFCSTSRTLFLSGSIDGEVRVYNLLDIKPLAVLHVECGLRSVSWSSQAHETRHSSCSVTKEGRSSEFETFLYCLLQNGILASFRFSLVSPSSLPHPSSSSPSSTSYTNSSLSEENNKLHPVAEFPLPSDDQITQGITYFSFNHFAGKEGDKLSISIATGKGVISIWQLI